MVSIKGKFEQEDLEAAQALFLFPGPNAIRIIVIVGFLLLSPILWLVVFPGSGMILFPIIYIILLMISFFLLASFVWNPFLLHPKARNKDAFAEFEMDFDEEAYHVRSAYGDTHIPWKDFIKWKADHKMILLYITDRMFHRIPRRYLKDSDSVYIFDQLRKNNVREIKLVKDSSRRIFRVITLAYLVLAIGVMVYINLR